MTELTLGLLLAPLFGLFTAAKDLLGPRFLVKNDADSGSHVNALTHGVIVEILAGKITLVPVNKVNLETLIWNRLVDHRHHVWLLDRA